MLRKMVAKKKVFKGRYRYEKWLLRKMVAKENGHKGRWFLKEDDRYEKCLL